MAVTQSILFLGAVIGGLNQRRGTIVDSEVREDEFTAVAEVALNDMFGYSGQLRGATQGKGVFPPEFDAITPLTFSVLLFSGEFIMEYKVSLGNFLVCYMSAANIDQ